MDNDAVDNMSTASRSFHRSVSLCTQPPTLSRAEN